MLRLGLTHSQRSTGLGGAARRIIGPQAMAAGKLDLDHASSASSAPRPPAKQSEPEARRAFRRWRAKPPFQHQPYVWRAEGAEILAKIRRARTALDKTAVA